MTAADFDNRARHFTEGLRTAANWKQGFFGGAYSTRIAQAVYHAELIIERAKQLLEDDGSPYDPAPFDKLYGRETPSHPSPSKEG